MSAAPILTALGIAGIVTTVAIAFMPILFADMRRAVQRGLRHDGKTDATALTLMIFGLSLIGAAGIGSVWLGSVWA